MSMIGLMGLLVAFAGVVVSIIAFIAGSALRRSKGNGAGETLLFGGFVAVIVTAIALTVCCGVLVVCFMTGDPTILYVAQYQSDSSDPLGWLYRLSGLWGGRQGSLLFWAWLISVFNAIVAARRMGKAEKLDVAALAVAQIVLAMFVGLLMFSEDNMPFIATPAQYFDEAGHLTGAAAAWGMNALLEHWAMAIHPPTLFIGYAGLTIPFAYAIGALVVNDSSATWVRRCSVFGVFSWLLLGVGIMLGSVWAYVVLGWGGYWGWDPVENASLLPWLAGLALIHSFTVYRQRGGFKRWAVMCACITFCFVVLGTFITRSGLVESVHAFAGDAVSLVLFLALMIFAIVAGVAGLIWRWKSFASPADSEDLESLASRDTAYLVNNIVMIAVAVLLAYFTISSALPEWMPLGGRVFSTGSYEAIARPLGILYCLLMAACPLVAWGRAEKGAFWRKIRVPLIAAIVVFAALMAVYVLYLQPIYAENIAYGGTAASDLTDYGPAWYYAAITIAGLFVASLLVCTSIAAFVRSARVKATGWRVRASAIGGFLSHAGVAVLLVGLIGSSMYVTERVGYVGYDEETDTATDTFTIRDYELAYVSSDAWMEDNFDDVTYEVVFDVYKGGDYLGQVNPQVQVVSSTMQQKLVASVISFPQEDLFVVYRGVNEEGAFSLDVRVNPFISFVWAGFVVMTLGALIALFAKRTAPSDRKAALAPETGDRA